MALKQLRDSSLPKLLYVGDVPVENSYHGSALLFRLLQDYPADRLCVVECGQDSERQRRLPAVTYQHLGYRFTRLSHTRFSKFASSVRVFTSATILRNLQKFASSFQPDAILTVGHGYSWFAARLLAEQLDLPLHFIIHDDIPEMMDAHGPAKRIFKNRFAATYQISSSRLCVSPYMVDAYKERYGAEGTLLYPARSKGVSSIPYRYPPIPQNSKLRFAFAGTLNSGGDVSCLNDLDNALTQSAIDAEIVLYGPFTEDQMRASGFESDRSVFGGLIPAQEIVFRLQETADVLFLPLSFSGRDRPNMKVHFPSKMTDYTATGLPILVYGPPDCSACLWSNANPKAVLAAHHPRELVSVVNQLKDFQFRVAMGKTAFDVGTKYFDHARAYSTFQKCLQFT